MSIWCSECSAPSEVVAAANNGTPIYRCARGHIWKGTPPHPAPPPFTDDEAKASEQIKESVLQAQEDKSPDKLGLVRAYLRGLGRDVTADDARIFCDSEGLERGPWLGSVFRSKEWEMVGWTTSREPMQHGTGIRVWRLAK